MTNNEVISRLRALHLVSEDSNSYKNFKTV